MTMDTSLVDRRRNSRARIEPIDPACSGWSQSFSSFGRRFLIRTNDPDLFGLLPDLLPPLAVRSSAVTFDRTYSLRRSGPCPCGATHESAALFGGRKVLFVGTDIALAGPWLRSALKLDVAEYARGRVFLHAGAVAWNGVGIVIPGTSMSGKTSLVSELLRAGATYYSDEYAVLDHLGRLHPYPQPLGVRLGKSVVQQDRTAASLGAPTATGRISIGLVVLTNYERDGRWNPEVLTQGNTVLGMLEHAVAIRRYPQRLLSALQHVAHGAVGWRGKRGDARETVQMILARLANR